MKWIKYIFGAIWMFFVFCFFQGCSKIKPIKNSVSYYQKGDKVFYAYHGSTYIMGKNEVEDADLETFEPINDYFAKDKNSVYWKFLKIDKADPKTFELLPDTEYGNTISNYYSKDRNNYFYTNKVLENVDADTFVIYGYNASDKNQIYCKGKAFSKKEKERCP